MILTLYALLVKYILPENTRPPCNYKLFGGGGGGSGDGEGGGPPPPPPLVENSKSSL